MTVPTLRAMKARGERITMITAYDATFARMLDEAGTDVLLVGDSLGMVIQGLDSTLPVTVDEVVYHCRAVARGTRHAHIVGDMPFMSYQGSVDEAPRNAGRFLKEGGAHAVKLEGGADVAEKIARIVAAGIPVMGHVGLTPQSVHQFGGFRVQGRGDAGHDLVLKDLREHLPKLEKRIKALGAPGFHLEVEPHLKGGGQFGGFSGPDGLGVAVRCLCRLLDYVQIGYQLRTFDDIRALRGF